MMRFDILTLFPDMFEAVLGGSIIGRAREKGLIELNFINIRDFSKDKHKKTDLYPYSGGGGMVMTPQPVYDAYESVAKDLPKKPKTLYMSPQGNVFRQKMAIDYAKEEHIVIICGHYEGMDQRILDLIVDEEVSIGDFVLTGGEIPAMAVVDAVSRLIPGVLAGESSYQNESHYNGLLEYPQYTRPEEFMGKKVPDILLSGHHAKIEQWKHEQSLINTLEKRPDMLKKVKLTVKDREFIKNYQGEKNMQKIFFYDTLLGRMGIREKNGEITGVSLHRFCEEGHVVEETEIIKKTAKEIEEYFQGKRKSFDVPLNPEGTAFQKKVWQALREIPYGEVRCYQDIASVCGNEKASRAVGMANHNNPIMILIPCHRVVGKNGSLTGYAGGLDIKEKLLRLEQENSGEEE